MPKTARRDPYRNFRFHVEIDGLTVAGFSDVEIGASFVDVIQYRDGSDKGGIRKLPGLHKTGDVTLKRGMTASRELFDWFRAVVTGDPSFRKNVAIAVLGEDGTVQARFLVREAWPMKYAASELHAKGNEVLIETLELANEGIERDT